MLLHSVKRMHLQIHESPTLDTRCYAQSVTYTVHMVCQLFVHATGCRMQDANCKMRHAAWLINLKHDLIIALLRQLGRQTARLAYVSRDATKRVASLSACESASAA